MSRKRVITARERDQITTELRAIMARWHISANTLGKLARVASDEARA